MREVWSITSSDVQTVENFSHLFSALHALNFKYLCHFRRFTGFNGLHQSKKSAHRNEAFNSFIFIIELFNSKL